MKCNNRLFSLVCTYMTKLLVALSNLTTNLLDNSDTSSNYATAHNVLLGIYMGLQTRPDNQITVHLSIGSHGINTSLCHMHTW